MMTGRLEKLNALAREYSPHHGLNVTAMYAVALLAEQPRLVGRMEGVLGLSAGGVVQLVDRLSKFGLAERSPVEGNRRKRMVRLTARGEQLADELSEILA